MDILLVIEDHFDGRGSLADTCRMWPEEIKVVTAADAREAMHILQKHAISLALYDLSSGYGLQPDNLAELTYRFPHIPCITVTRREQELDETVLGLGASLCLHAPPTSEELRGEVCRLLETSNSGAVKGIPVHSLLQMFESDQKTCTMRIQSKNGKGLLYMEQGVLVAAQTDNQLNEDAVYTIVAWDEVSMEIQHYNGQRPREIEQSLLALIMEGFRLKDERESFEEQQVAQNRPKLQLQHLSTAGSRISLEMGAKVKLELDHLEYALTSIMVGMIPNQYLIITAPVPYEEVGEAIKNRHRLVIKYLHMGRLCMFKTRVVEEIDAPRHLLFLEYPPVIHFHELRRAKRTSIFVPTTLQYGDGMELSGVLIDLSSMGCLFMAKVRGGGALPNFDIDSPVELRCLLPGISESQALQGTIRNIKKSSNELRVGIQFDTLPTSILQAIENYVASVERVVK